MSAPLLRVEQLAVSYHRRRHGAHPVFAVDDVSFGVGAGETVALVGESGSGKTTIGRAVLGLTPVTSGRVFFDGLDITHATRGRRRQLSRELQVVFQDPVGSLNPTKSVGEILAEPLRVHRRPDKDELTQAVSDILVRVGLPPETGTRYPAQLSGGQRQRVAIARALMLSPRLIICDEPLSALDLSIQAQILNLLRELQEETGVSFLLISHDVSVVRYLSTRVIVLYRGRIVESGDTAQVHDAPVHPYTRALLAAAPVADPAEQRARRQEWLRLAEGRRRGGETREGCSFSSRCPFAIDACALRPSLAPASNGALVACHRKDERGW